MTGYGLRYYAEFDSFKGALESYRLNIFLKGYNYPEEPANRLLFAQVPVVQEWQDDDPKQPIRGCTLDCKFITDANGVHLSNFYSEDDLQFYCEFRLANTDQLLFAGFLLQDDCAELQVDFNHEIRLLFTDMLGTLKDVTLDQAAVIGGTWQIESGIQAQDYSGTISNTILIQDPSYSAGKIKPGQRFKLYNGIADIEFFCFSIEWIGGSQYVIKVNDSSLISTTLTTYDLKYLVTYNLEGRIPIIDLIRLSLQSTYLQLQLKSYVNIYPLYSSAIEEIWQDTYVNIQDYYQGGNWANCYEILEKIFSRLGCSLFQCDGYWTIIRWAEIYKYTKTSGADLQGHYFDWDFTYLGTTSYLSDFYFINGSDMETGVIRSLIRPKQYVQETMNYQIPELLKNQDLNETGALTNQYTSGTDTIYEYELPYWVDNPASPSNTVYRLLRVIYDQYNNEKDRYIVIFMNGAGTNNYELQSNDIELSQGDSIKFNFSVRTTNSEPGPINLVFNILINDGINPTNNINTDGSWQTTGGYVYSIPSGANLQDWQSVEIISKPIPFDCILRVYIGYKSLTTGNLTHYKGLSFTRDVPYSGHQNRDNQDKEIKNNIDVDISIDNTPRSSIVGSLFTNEFLGIIRQRTQQWTYPGISYPYNSLGIATTQEELYQNYTPRAKYEGNLLYTKQDSGPYKFVNPLSVFSKLGSEIGYYRFVPGKVTIDYKNAAVDLTLYEIISNFRGFDDGGNVFEYLAWASKTYYEFKYLYDK